MSDGLFQRLEARLSELHADVTELKSRLSRRDWYTDPGPDPWEFRHGLEDLKIAEVLAKMKGIPAEKVGLEQLQQTTMGEVAQYALHQTAPAAHATAAHATARVGWRRPPFADPPPIWWWFADPAPGDWMREELDLNKNVLEWIAQSRGVAVEKVELADLKAVTVGELVARATVARARRTIPKKPEITDPPNLRDWLEGWMRSGLEHVSAAQIATLDRAGLETLQHQLKAESARLEGLSKVVEAQIKQIGGP